MIVIADDMKSGESERTKRQLKMHRIWISQSDELI